MKFKAEVLQLNKQLASILKYFFFSLISGFKISRLLLWENWNTFLLLKCCMAVAVQHPSSRGDTVQSDYILITNLMHWLLFIHKILFSSTCFEPYVLIFGRIQLYTCSIWYCHSLREFVVACRHAVWVRTQTVYRQTTTNSHIEWQYHMLHVYNCILLKMSTSGSKHVEENNILWINNNQFIKLVINV